jgi:Sulfatase
LKTRAFLTPAAFIAIGAFLGWFAANCRPSPILRAGAAPPTAQKGLRPSGSPANAEESGCFSQGLSKAQMLALATHNQTVAANSAQSGRKPNIVIMWGDDIGWFNPSCYHGGVMGYQTPNIDRIARECARFTDWYGQQSCSAGPAAFIMGQSPIRTGLTKVGLPGATLGIQPQDPTIAELLKPHGYVCGQFGKNHLALMRSRVPRSWVRSQASSQTQATADRETG